MSAPYRKRLLDVALSAAALATVGPLLAIVAAAVKLESPGSAFFVQERVGRGKRAIRVVKFRTMVAGADRLGPSVTAAGDTRVTRVGAVLRRTKLDELPQLWNVLRGDMSIVGPRPEVPRYVAEYRAEWDPVFDVRPGLTDLASIVFRDEEAVLAKARDRERAYKEVILPMKIDLALRGIAASSIGSDLEVIGRTVLAILRRETPDRRELLAEVERRIANLDGGP